MHPRVLTLLTVLAVVLGLAATASARPIIGIADQKVETFSDPRFAALGLRHARINVAWDVLTVPADRDVLDAWMSAAHAAGVAPLVTLDRSRSRAKMHRAPTVGQYATQARALHARYPFVREWSTWNEANHYGQPTGRHPELAARYWLALRKACPGCTILGADILDQPNMGRWTAAFTRAARRLGGPAPSRWGLHNYVDANRLRTTGTRAFLRAVKGRVWFTEVGGLVKRGNASTTKLPAGVSHAAKVTRFILERLSRLSPRIERVYLYNWNTRPQDKSWDSGFIGPDGKARPALGVLKSALASSRFRR